MQYQIIKLFAICFIVLTVLAGGISLYKKMFTVLESEAEKFELVYNY